MKKRLLLFAMMLIAMAESRLGAQTNPTPVSLPFSLTSQSSATLPAGVAVHKFAAIPTTRTTLPTAGDLTNQGSAPLGTTGGWYNLGTDGIGMIASGTNQAGAIVVAINTTGMTNVQVSWICKTIYNQLARDNSVALQYRVGTSGNFTDVGTASTYTTTGKANGNASSIFTETLPAVAENQPVVQVRWIQWELFTSGSRDKVAVDDISITGTAGSTCNAPASVTASGITTTDANLSWPAASGATAYEYALTTAAAPPASGTNTVATAYNATGLTAATIYYFHVRSACSGSTFSGWTTQNFTTAAPACNAPASVSASGITSTTATISWPIVSGAIAYEYAVTTSATPPGSGTNTTATSYNASGLLASTTYYAHVRSACAGSTFSGWTTQSFTTAAPACVAPAGITASGITTTTATLSWPAAPGATAYEYAVNTSIIPPASGTNTTATSYNASGLTAATTYYFHVRSACAGGLFSDWTSQSFTTASATSCSAPASITVINITSSGASISWPAGTGADSYQFALTTLSTPPGAGVGTTGTSFNASTLNAATTYYFYVRSVCPDGSFSGWTAQSFTTLPSSTCNAPVSINVASITTTTATITWPAVSGAVAYEYAVTTSATPPASGTATTATSYHATSLSPSTNYYVHIRSRCSDTLFSGWTTQGFATPATFTCNTPSGISVTDLRTTSATISWPAVPGTWAYEYAITTSATPPASGTATTTTSCNTSGLTLSTTYYTHVRTQCEDNLFSVWTTQSFTTPLEDPADDSDFTVMTYNLLNYPGSNGAARDPSFRTVISSANPDILVVQELSGGYTTFQNNVLEQVDTNYTGGTFIDGPDTDNGIYFKRARFQFISNTPVHTSLRDISEFRLRHIGSGDTLIIFSAHLKASNTAADEAQRASEVDALRARTDGFAAGKNFLVCGDFNIYGSGESAYVKLTQNGNNANGKFNDVLSMSGTWNNAAYAFYHTQSPRTTSFGGGATGGMDDRFDMLLFSNAIIQAGGFDVVSNSYKAYGNDGQHYNKALNTPPYNMYSSTVAAALHDVSDHIPVVVKLRHVTTGARSGQSVANMTADQLLIYPNPTHDIVYIRAIDTRATDRLNLYDLNGRLLREVILHGDATITVDLSSLNSGIYYLRSVTSGTLYKIVRY